MQRLPLVAVAIFASFLTGHAQLVRQPNTSLTPLPANLPIATGYTTENALGTLTFSQPMCSRVAPGETNRLFVAQRGGTIQVVTNLSTTPTKGASAYFNLTSLLTTGQTLRTDGENGFLSLIFHPNFATNGTFFVYFSIDVGGTLYQRLHQVTVANPAANFGATSTDPVVIQSHKPLLTILDRATNHDGGDLHFGPDGFLYLSLGDEGGGGDQYNNARFINHQNDASVHRTGFWGKLLRLAVEVDPKLQPGVFPAGSIAPNPHVQNSTDFLSALHGNYRIPADNPFIGYTLWHSLAISGTSVRTEIFATGLRNPFRWNFDPPTGRIFIGDVGQNIYEEVDLVSKGDDLGWSWREGFHQFVNPPTPTTPPAAPNAGDPPGTGFLRRDPIYEYDHTNDGSGNDAIVYGPNITGGIVYRGGRLTELYGAYIFSDYGNGFIVALREQSNGTWTATRLATDNALVDFGTDPRNGDVIFCDIGDGKVKRLARSGTTGTAPPALLSQTGAFSNFATLTPNTGIVDYEPNVDFWSDYAFKSRWFSIPNVADKMTFSADGNWTFPTGTVWIKNFDIDTVRGNSATRRKLETRFLVKTATDVYGLSYKWRDDQTDADLVAESGTSTAITGSSPSQTWRFPSRAECLQCHTQVAGLALSFNTRQMNRAHPYGSISQNQISALSDAGYFTSAVSGVNNMPALVSGTDTTMSLESRVRSYLAVNCVQCHQPGGAAIGNWDARPTVPTDAANLINGTLVNNGGDTLNRWAVPGDLTHSMVLKRLQGNGFTRMPPLASNERDLVSEQLLIDWISNDLPSRQTFAQWQVAQFGSTFNPDGQSSADPDFDGIRNDLEYLLRTNPHTPSLNFQSSLQAIGNTLQLTFEQPANRSVLIETSTDLQTWSLWDNPGNAPNYSANNIFRTLSAPISEPKRFFRTRVSSQ